MERTSRGPELPSELHRKLVWVTTFRGVAAVLLLVMLGIRAFARAPVEELPWEESASYVVIALTFLATLFYGVILRYDVGKRPLAYAQVIGDVALATSLVILTGGLESPFSFFYLLAIVVGSILLFQRGAFVSATLSSLSLAGALSALQMGWIVPSNLVPSTWTRVGVALISNVFAQYLIAALSAYLSRQLWAAGGAISNQEETLKKLANLQRQILTNMPSGLITCDQDGQVTFVNRAALGILQISETSWGEKQVTELLPGVFDLGSSRKRGELAVMTAGGRKILGLTVTTLEGSDGAHLVVFQDLTELRRAEDELKRVDRLAALGTMAAQLAHEIRNPLASMRGSAQMLAADAPAEGHSRKLAGILIRESDRLSKLLEEFLRFARPPTPQLQVTSLKQLVGEVVEMLGADPIARGVRLKTQLSDVSASVDSDQIRQVLINILRNAFAATYDIGGEVRVILEGAAGAPTIRIWDSAGSIPPEDLTRIFEPFFTTREGGTGLGLSTAHSIVRAHGGMIRVTSSRFDGTEFVVRLPAVSNEVAA